MSSDANAPFAIQLEVEFLDRLTEPVREGKAKSVSEIIRTALECFNLENVVVVRPPQVTISVRLPGEIRRDLKRVAHDKHTSVGLLVRSAVEAFLPRLESGAVGQLEMEMPTSITSGEPAAAAPKSRAKTARPRSAPKAKARKPARARAKPIAKKKSRR